MKSEIKLKRAIKRSERAYELYLGEKKYFQALRIYRANNTVYDLLGEYVFHCEETYLNDVFMYMFHLEDWFEQFETCEKASPALDDNFVFNRIKGSVPFPKDFVERVLGV